MWGTYSRFSHPQLTYRLGEEVPGLASRGDEVVQARHLPLLVPEAPVRTFAEGDQSIRHRPDEPLTLVLHQRHTDHDTLARRRQGGDQIPSPVDHAHVSHRPRVGHDAD